MALRLTEKPLGIFFVGLTLLFLTAINTASAQDSYTSRPHQNVPENDITGHGTYAQGGDILKHYEKYKDVYEAIYKAYPEFFKKYEPGKPLPEIYRTKLDPGERIAPSSPNFIFRTNNGQVFIWDAEDKTVYDVTTLTNTAFSKNIEPEDVYKMAEAAGKTLKPHELKLICVNWAESGARRYSNAKYILELYKISSLPGPFMIYNDVNKQYDNFLLRAKNSPDQFIAQYVFDRNFKEKANQTIADLYTSAVVRKNSQIAYEVKEFARIVNALNEGFIQIKEPQAQDYLKILYPDLYKADYQPGGTDFILKPAASDQPTLIWNDDYKEFYVVPKDVPLDEILKMKSLINEPVNAEDLASIAKYWGQDYRPRLEQYLKLSGILGVFSGLKPEDPTYQAYLRVVASNKEVMNAYTNHPEKFLSKYVMDTALHSYFLTVFDNLVLELCQNKDTFSDGLTLIKTLKEMGVYLPVSEKIEEMLKTEIAKEIQKQESRKLNFNKPAIIRHTKPAQPAKPVQTYTPPQTTYTPPQTYQPPQQPKPAQENKQYLCDKFMQNLSSEVNRYEAEYGQYTLKITRPYTYIDGFCVGAHEIWRQKPDGSAPYAETIYYSPENPGKIPASSIK